MFCQKLDFLMNLTNSHNIDLARAVEMDASAVSRLRSGTRKPPKSLAFLPAMSSFFAKGLTDEHQRKAAADLICPGHPWPERHERAAELIGLWLAQSSRPQFNCVEELISGISNLEFPSAPSPELAKIQSSLPPHSLYYGIEGLQKAYIAFFDAAIATHSAHTIYLFTDEDTGWMDSDPEYLSAWTSRMKQLISAGCKFKIIYSTACPDSQLISSIKKWLPMYITKAIEPYYYPKIRDGVYRRTLFVASGTAALQASSLGEIIDGMLSHLVTDPAGVNALEAELKTYLGHCRPLLELVTGAGSYAGRVLEHERTPGSFFLAGMTPSLFTMPLRVAERVCYRSTGDELFDLCKKLKGTDLTRNGSRQLCELITVPSDEQIAADEIPVGFGALLGMHECCYTANEFSVHLKSVSEFARLHRSYSFDLTDRLPRNIIIYCKEHEYAAISKCSMPCYTFVFRQPAIVNAVCLYLREIYSSAQRSGETRISYAELLKKLR